MAELVPHIVWEKQEGYLCAQHCINSLLQGEYFTAVDLSEIANNLDMAEQAALREGTIELTETLHNETLQNETPAKSQNMDDSGFFSLQVLNHALKVWSLELIPVGSEEGRNSRDHPENEAAYICNLNEHWFTLRRFGGSPSRWYNLDSLLNGPKFISQTYLGMLLSQLENEGYSIFVVRGILPACQADEFAVNLPDPSTQHSLSPRDTDFDADLEAAIAESLKVSGLFTTKSSTTEEETKKMEEETKKIKDETKKIEDETKEVEDETKKIEDETKKVEGETKKTEELSLEDLRAKRLARFEG